MKADERFIPGIYNYCDRWCERCSHTGKCRSFALEQALEPMVSGQDPHNRDDHLQNARFALNTAQQSLHELLRTNGESEEVLAALEGENDPDFLDDQLQQLVTVASRYSAQAVEAIRPFETPVQEGCGAVVARYAFFIPPKVERAAKSLVLARIAPDGAWLGDALGSMKIALIAIDRSLDALQHEVSSLPVSRQKRFELVEQLRNLRSICETAFPQARDYIRPGLDETPN
jgi:hypothetical protein